MASAVGCRAADQHWCLGSAFLFADVDRGEATSNEQQRLVGT
jgi:hypothetical protein